jgi:hypothetical protein
MGYVPRGGYVITTTHQAIGRMRDVDEATLKKVAELLGIPQIEDQLPISGITSIFIYREPKK